MPLNGKTTIEIANRLPVLFTPANYVFSFGLLFMLLLACWLFGFRRNKEKVGQAMQNRRALLFIFSCLFNIAWILLWHFGYFNWTVVVMGALLLTLLALYFTYPKKDNRFLRKNSDCDLSWMDFCHHDHQRQLCPNVARVVWLGVK